MKRKQTDISQGWLWAAAVACMDRALSGEAWYAGNDVAECMLVRVYEPGHLVEALNGDPADLDDLGEAVGRPKTAADWRDHADVLWERLAVETGESRIGTLGDYQWAQPGKVGDVTPYHIHVETRPGEPYFHRRALDPPDPQLAESLLIAGRNLRPIVLVPGWPWPTTTRAKDVQPPIVIAGRGRTGAARLANSQQLDRIVAEMTQVDDPLTVPAPRILGVGYSSKLRHLGELEVAFHLGAPLQLIGCLRVEVVDPDDALAVQAALADNDGQRPETALSNARQIRDLQESFKAIHGRELRTTELSSMKRVSPDTVANWVALLQLRDELQGMLERGEIAEAEAYRLARIPANRQMSVWEKTRSFKSVAERVAAINALARGDQAELPATPTKPTVPGRKAVSRAVERMQSLTPAPASSAQAGARAVLRLMAGVESALDGLPPEVAQEVRQLLADEPKALEPAPKASRGRA